VLGVYGHVVLGDDGHLLGVHLISIDEIAEEAGVRVGEVEGLVEDEIGVVAEVGMEGVVLQMRGVQMVPSELVASVLSDDALEVIHGEEIRIVPAGSSKSHGEGSVEHLIVTLVEQGRSEIGLF
jgi:hypothetical protein